MLKRIVKSFFTHVVFLGFIFGFLYVLLIIGSGINSWKSSAHFYFWVELPLVIFGLIYGFCGILLDEWKNSRTNRLQLGQKAQM